MRAPGAATRALLPLRYAGRNALARPAATAVTGLGVAIAVMVYVVMAATAESLQGLAARTGDPANVLVTSKGAGSAESSRLDLATARGVRFAPGVARDAGGATLASVEKLDLLRITVAGGDPDAPADQRYTAVRGVTPAALRVRPALRLLRGRLPEAADEIAIGRLVPENLGPLDVGDTLHLRGVPHRVVGVLGARGQFFESELWVPLETLLGALGERQASQVLLRTAGPEAATALVERLESSRQWSVSARTEPEYFARLERASSAFVYLGNLIGALLGLGAVVAGANTLYATMSQRIREMGTLRALGFGRWQVGATLLVESALVAAVGGAMGVAGAALWDGFGVSILGLAFELDVDAASALRGLAMAALIGVAGALLPARSAARLEIVAALRHS